MDHFEILAKHSGYHPDYKSGKSSIPDIADFVLFTPGNRSQQR